MRILDSAHFLGNTKVTLSRGSGVANAKIYSEVSTTLAAFVSAQIAMPREGMLGATEYANATKKEKNADKAEAGGDWYSFAHYDNQHRNESPRVS